MKNATNIQMSRKQPKDSVDCGYINIKINPKGRVLTIGTGNTWTAVKTLQYQFQDGV